MFCASYLILIMRVTSQRLNYKISPMPQKYEKVVQENLCHSYTTFNDVETPGWSSLIKSQISENPHRKTLRSETHQSRAQVVTEGAHEGNRRQTLPVEPRSRLRKIDTTDTKDKHETRDTIKRANQQQPHDTSSRWNQLTVHEHLFFNHHKRQQMRLIVKKLDEEYKKKNVCPFQPTISERSRALAQLREEKLKNKQRMEEQFQVDKKDCETRVSTEEKDCKQVQRYKLLNKIFYYLSNNQSLLDRTTLDERIQKLPLPCIKTLEPILQQLYKNKTFEWIDFLQLFNSNQTIKKESFYKIMSKWFQRQNIQSA